MGMSIEESINGIKKRILPIFDNDADHKALETAIDTMRKYQMMQADYEARLKVEKVAMLTEILTDFDNQIEPNSTRIDCESIIEQKIQALEEKTYGEK